MHDQYRKIDSCKILKLRPQGLSSVHIARRLGVGNVAIHRVWRDTVCGHPNAPRRPPDGRSATGQSG